MSASNRPNFTRGPFRVDGEGLTTCDCDDAFRVARAALAKASGRAT